MQSSTSPSAPLSPRNQNPTTPQSSTPPQGKTPKKSYFSSTTGNAKASFFSGIPAFQSIGTSPWMENIQQCTQHVKEQTEAWAAKTAQEISATIITQTTALKQNTDGHVGTSANALLQNTENSSETAPLAPNTTPIATEDAAAINTAASSSKYDLLTIPIHINNTSASISAAAATASASVGTNINIETTTPPAIENPLPQRQKGTNRFTYFIHTSVQILLKTVHVIGKVLYNIGSWFYNAIKTGFQPENISNIQLACREFIQQQHPKNDNDMRAIQRTIQSFRDKLIERFRHAEGQQHDLNKKYKSYPQGKNLHELPPADMHTHTEKLHQESIMLQQKLKQDIDEIWNSFTDYTKNCSLVGLEPFKEKIYNLLNIQEREATPPENRENNHQNDFLRWVTSYVLTSHPITTSPLQPLLSHLNIQPEKIQWTGNLADYAPKLAFLNALQLQPIQVSHKDEATNDTPKTTYTIESSQGLNQPIAHCDINLEKFQTLTELQTVDKDASVAINIMKTLGRDFLVDIYKVTLQTENNRPTHIKLDMACVLKQSNGTPLPSIGRMPIEIPINCVNDFMEQGKTVLLSQVCNKIIQSMIYPYLNPFIK